MRPTLLCLFLLVALVALPQRAHGADVIDLQDPIVRTWFGEQWYGLFRGNARVGWMRRSLREATVGGEPGVIREVEIFVNVAGDGNTVRSVTSLSYAARGRQLLVRAHTLNEEQGSRTSRDIVREGGRFDVVTQRADGKHTGAVAAIDAHLADELAGERLVAGVAAAQEPPEDLRMVVTGLDLHRLVPTRKVLRFRADEQTDSEPAGLRIRAGDGGERWSDAMVVDATGAIVEGDLYAQLVVRRDTEQRATAKETLDTVERATRVPLAGDAGKASDAEGVVSITFSCSAAAAKGVFQTSGRQRVEEKDGRVLVTVERDGQGERVMAVAQERSLKATRLVDAESKPIRRAADQVLRGTSQRAGQVNRLLDWVPEQVEYMVVLGDPPASRVLEQRRGDCTEHSRLFMALCRAAKIPAREVRGLLWMGERAKAFGWHSWAEVALAGYWREVDPTSGDLPAHVIRLRVAPEVMDVIDLGELDIRVESIEREAE